MILPDLLCSARDRVAPVLAQVGSGDIIQLDPGATARDLLDGTVAVTADWSAVLAHLDNNTITPEGGVLVWWVCRVHSVRRGGCDGIRTARLTLGAQHRRV